MVMTEGVRERCGAGVREGRVAERRRDGGKGSPARERERERERERAYKYSRQNIYFNLATKLKSQIIIRG